MRLRQLALIAADLEAATARIQESLGLEVAYRDPAVATFGLRNIVCPIGTDDFLEVVSPVAEGTPADRFLHKRGDGAYMLLLECTDLVAVRAAIGRLGIRVVGEHEAADFCSLHLHPKDCGGMLTSIDWCPNGWSGAGPEWRSAVRTHITSGFHAVDFACPDAAGVARTWAELTGCPIVDGSLVLDNARIRFVEAEPDEPGGVRSLEVLAAAGADRAGTMVDVCGVPMTFVPDGGGRG